jgi:uncharacterized protein YjbI with pentapeptide repeats
MNLKELCHLYATGKRDFGPLNLNEANLRGVNLSGAILKGSRLIVANLSGANLSGADLSNTKLHVARLSGTNLIGAKFNQAQLNVANLIRADLRNAELIEAVIIRSELVRANLSGANLSGANLNGTDLREASLRQVNLSYCNLSETNLRGANLTEGNLEQVDLSSGDLTRAKLIAANLRDADLSHARLMCADLTGADLRGANLRWTDLSGANLTGADLRDANLINASLVHADLSRVRLMRAEWDGADLTGATLTGAMLHNVLRSNLKTTNLSCEWVDLSPLGDGSEVRQLRSEQVQSFFKETRPMVKVAVDAPFNLSANLALATIYHQITQAYPRMEHPPSIQITTRRTYLTFTVNRNSDLFLTAYCVMLPFLDSEAIGTQLQKILSVVTHTPQGELSKVKQEILQQWYQDLKQLMQHLASVKAEQDNVMPQDASLFLESPTYTVLTNANNHSIDLYHHPYFGKYIPAVQGDEMDSSEQSALPEMSLPPLQILIQFMQDCFT